MVAVALSEPLVKALRVAGPAFFLGMQGSSMRTALSIIAEKSVGQLRAVSPLPFVSLLTNCVIWTCYGALRSDMSVLIPNGIGVISGLGCATAYQRYTTNSPKAIYGLAALIIASALALAYYGNHKLLGTLGCGLAVSLMASPLATLGIVIKEKSTASMPFSTSFLGFCNCASWSAYGLLVARDVMIYGPNLAGLFLASIQMFLFGIFGLPPAKAAKQMF